jgi:hypothetical protein
VRDNAAVVKAATSPLAVFWSLAGILLYFFLLGQKQELVSLGIPSWQRRAATSLVDFYFSVNVVVGLEALVPLGLEALRTGHFAWRFERHYTVPTDFNLGVPVVLFTLGLLFLYFVYPLTSGKQTIGCYVLRVRVTPPFGDRGRFTFREAARRTWYEFKGCASMPFKKDRDQDSYGRTWWDRETECTVVPIENH